MHIDNLTFEITIVSVPSTPPIVIEAKGMGRKVVLLKFVVPSISNGRIIGYKANIYLDDPDTGVGRWKSQVLDENANEMYMDKLLNQNNLYWFKVAAKTVAGFGPYSRAVKAETLAYDRKLELAVIIINNNNLMIIIMIKVVITVIAMLTKTAILLVYLVMLKMAAIAYDIEVSTVSTLIIF